MHMLYRLTCTRDLSVSGKRFNVLFMLNIVINIHSISKCRFHVD